MSNELDDIPAECDCPACGVKFDVSYKTMRLNRTVECPGCGETIRPSDDTPIGAIQRLIEEAEKSAPLRTRMAAAAGTLIYVADDGFLRQRWGFRRSTPMWARLAPVRSRFAKGRGPYHARK